MPSERSQLEIVPSVPNVVSLEAMKAPILFSVLAAFALFSPCLAPAQAADATAPFADAVAYCQGVGSADAPDAGYTGPAVPDWMVPALYSKEELKAQKSAKVDPARAIVWRCMQGKVWACVQGNSPICGKANQEMKPSQAMRAFCSGQPNAEVIPLSVIGHENPMIYDWSCKGQKPAIARQIFTVDARLSRRAVERDRARAEITVSGGLSERVGPDPFTPVHGLAGNATLTPTESLKHRPCEEGSTALSRKSAQVRKKGGRARIRLDSACRRGCRPSRS